MQTMKFATIISQNCTYPKLMKQKSNNPQQKYEPLKFKVRLQTLCMDYKKRTSRKEHLAKVQIRSSAIQIRQKSQLRSPL